MGEKRGIFWGCNKIRTTRGNIYRMGLYTNGKWVELSILPADDGGERDEVPGWEVPIGIDLLGPGLNPPTGGGPNPERTHFWSL